MESPKGNNLGFNDKAFEKEMRMLGWRPGQSWCSWFVSYIRKIEKINHEGFKVDFKTGLARNYINRYSISAIKKPKMETGDLVIWQKGATIYGHIGIFIGYDKNNNLIVLEGNTNEAGSENGDGVYIKIRKINPLAYFRITHITKRRI